jgi:hypothetical protein
MMLPLLLLLAQPGAEATGDLDGDGKNEVVHVEMDPNQDGRCLIIVGELKAIVPDLWEEGCTVEIVDLDATEKKRELLATGSSANDYRTMVFYRFEKKALKVLGSVTGMLSSTPEIGGGGFVVIPIWAGFFSQKKKLVLEKDKLAELVPELYSVESKVKVKGALALVAHRDKKDVLARLKVGSEIDLLAYDPSPKCKADKEIEPCDWFLVRSSSGLLGWVTFEALEAGAELPWAG